MGRRALDTSTLQIGRPAPPEIGGRTHTLLRIGLVLAVALLLALVVLPPLVDGRAATIRTRAEQVQHFSDTLGLLESDMQQMQSASRGYLATRMAPFLEQYRTMADQLPARLDELRQLAAALDPPLEPPIDELLESAERWQREGSDRQIALVQQGRGDEAAAELASGVSQALFDGFQSRLGAARSEAQAVQRDLQGQLSSTQTLQVVLTLALSVLGLIAVALTVVGFRRVLQLMDELQRERAHAAALAERVKAQLEASELHNRQLTVFHTVATASAIDIGREARAQNVLGAVVGALRLRAGALWAFGAASGSLELLARSPAQADASRQAQSAGAARRHLAATIEGGRMEMLGPGVDAGGPPIEALLGGGAQPVRSAIILPLHGRREPIGALVLASDLPDHFDDCDRSFYETLATEVGLVLENALLYATAQTERQRLQTVFDHSPEGIVVADAASGQIALANHAAADLLGTLREGAPLEPHPLAGRVFLPGGIPCAAEALPLVQTLRDGSAQRGVELVVEQPDGRRVPVLVTSVPLRDEGGFLRGAVAVFQDLRQLREVERLKSDFVALVSHELRTPLTTIIGCTQTLLRTPSGDISSRVRDFLQIIDEQSERLHELIDNLLSMSQLEAGALRLRRELVELPPLLQRLVRQLAGRMGAVRLQAELPTRLPPVSADPRRIEQVIGNLVDNARKFSPPDGVVTISASDEGGAVRLAVRDQGPGVSPAERERIFERFYQGSQPAARSVGGTGLGLAICRALVEAHGGRIGVGEAPGGGAEVWFTLPAGAGGAALPPPAPSVLAREEIGATRVLVVDDDPALRRMLEGGLREAGYRVQAAVEASAALDVAATAAPDLILLDLMLPGTDGFALCGQLREWSTVPIIMLTARAAEQDIVRGLQLGADDYITKPFSLSELLARIEAVLRRSRTAGATGEQSLVQVGELAIDLARRRVTVAGEEVDLTPTEYAILGQLARHAGQVLTHEQILQAVWGDSYGDENHYLWVHVAHLRRKIEASPRQPRYILTARGIGYRLAKV